MSSREEKDKRVDAHREILATNEEEIREVLKEAIADGTFDDRAIHEISFAVTYATSFAHGTVSHNQLMIIYHLYRILESKK